MVGERQKSQRELAFPEEGRGEAPRAPEEGTEPSVAGRRAESPALTERAMEEVCEEENVRKALRRVRENKGGPGVDGMTVGELPGYLKEHWPAIREQLLGGTYRPQAVKRTRQPPAHWPRLAWRHARIRCSPSRCCSSWPPRCTWPSCPRR